MLNQQYHQKRLITMTQIKKKQLWIFKIAKRQQKHQKKLKPQKHRRHQKHQRHQKHRRHQNQR